MRVAAPVPSASKTDELRQDPPIPFLPPQAREGVLVWMLAEHHPAAAGRRGKRSERGVGPHRHLPLAGGATELFDAVGVHGRARAAVAEVAAAGAKGMRPFDTDIAGVKRERVT